MQNVNNDTLGRPREVDDNGEPWHRESRAAQGGVILSFSHRAVSARERPQQIHQYIKLGQHLRRTATYPGQERCGLDVGGFEDLLNAVLSVAVLSV